ncbi:MAG TPA: type VI secretion system protein TssA [Acidobacteriaceae bacterium]|jgi:type VI secretion system protein ImpA
MPLRDDLLTPIPGDNPSGVNLQYDVKVFDVIKEARIEDDESIPTGNWGRTAKKADRNLVIKVAGDALATRSKDLRLAGWYLESLLRKEGYGILSAGIELLQKLQEEFWDSIYPEKDPDDGSLDLRIAAIEAAGANLSAQLKQIPLTKSGISYTEYQDAQSLGFEKDPRSSEKAAIRADAVARGKLVAEDNLKGIEGTTKAFYADTEKELIRSLEMLDEFDRVNEEKYGSDYPSVTKLKKTIEEVKLVITYALNEKRKTDPDPIVVEETPEEEGVEGAEGEEGTGSGESAPARKKAPRRDAPVGAPDNSEDAYLQVAACADLIRSESPASAVPYLLCAALRLGETRTANLADATFAVAPETETRRQIRKLANQSNWNELASVCIQTLSEPCGRAWLDLHRYVWQAAQGSGNEALANAVTSTVRSLLMDFPAIRTLTLDDDTSAANSETQQWLDAQVMR